MKQNYTHIAAVLDRSGSMRSIIDKTLEGFNGFVAEQQRVPGEATLSLAIFDDRYETVHDFVNLQDVPLLTRTTFFPRGWTAQYDAMAKTIIATGERLAALPEDERPSKVIVLVMTDGEENHSVEFPGETGRAALKAMIEEQTNTYSWEFVFMGANIDAQATGASLGFKKSHVAQYAATNAGTLGAFESMSRGLTSSRTQKGYNGDFFGGDRK